MKNTNDRSFSAGVCALALIAALGCGDDDGSTDVDAAPESPASRLNSFGDEQAGASIQTLSGCYLVRYQFIEDGQKDFFVEDNIEYMDVIAAGGGYVARNFLVIETPPGSDTFTSFLHWVQDWTPMADGVWNLKVSDGDGNERWQADGVWRFNQFESVAADATKPNRDSERNDYATLERRNAIQLTGGNWIHSQLNVKKLDDGSPVSSEVGWIVYAKQQDETPCDPAKAIANP